MNYCCETDSTPGIMNKYNYNSKSDKIMYQNQYSMQRDIEFWSAKFYIKNNHT